MFKNVLLLAFRKLRKDPRYTLLNVSGLAIGMTCCMLIMLFVYGELRYDRHHKKADRIVRVVEIIKEDGQVVEESASVPFPVGPTLAQAFPGLKQVRFYKTFEKVPLLRYGEKRFYEENLLFTDSTVFEIFDYPFVQGNPEKALNAPFSIVLTEKMAKKYFGKEPALGKTLRFENQIEFTVTGVIKDLPPTAHMHFDFLASFLQVGDLFRASGTTFPWTGWYWNPCHTYLLLPSELSEAQLSAGLGDFVQKHAPPFVRPNMVLYLQKLTDIHLKSHLYQEAAVNGSTQTVYLFTVIAAFILLIACINFMNLATARSVRRAREVAVRKVVGAFRGQLFRQFFGESLLLSFSAGLLALGLLQLSLPLFSKISGTEVDISLVGYPVLLGATAVLALVAGLVAGIYPAVFLSGYKPVDCLKLKNAPPASFASIFFRKGLVVFQFGISIALLIGTVAIYRQHKFLQHKELGFDKEQLLMIPIRGTAVKPHVEAFKQRIRRESGVVNAAALSNIVGNDVQVVPFLVEGKDKALQIPGLFVDHDFIKTFGVQVKQGRGFDPAFPTDSSAFILNEAAVIATGWTEPIGKRMSFNNQGQVIGVVADFNFAKLRERIRPMGIKIDTSWFSYIAVRMAPGDVPGTIRKLETAWREFEPDRPFESFFLDDNLNALYEKEARMSLIFTAFSILAIIIGCLGLFGLATFAAEQRLKEISVRRVLGASVTGIVGLLSKEFLILVGIAFLLASPLAWYGLNEWMKDFPYRTELSWWIFPLAGLVSVAIAFLTVSFQSIKAAMANPVKSLRSD